ncbi:TMBIM4 [Cordylochernes scorpioides]|uniref:TMBIM4 n=1 Tax=Cordylochernes scorpioides TaxID=51811 RepID=A0ABY6L4X7_9ARAC|nr:TMBIM4 [Cordylochernes scorpioides]
MCSLFTGLWILIITGFLGVFLGSTGLELLMATAGSFLFSGFIIYDTQRLMNEVSPEEYILATIELYLDILNLFLHLLRLLEAIRRK